MGAEHHRTCVEGKKTGGSVASSSFTQPNASPPPPSPLFSSFHLSSISLVSSLFPLFCCFLPLSPFSPPIFSLPSHFSFRVFLGELECAWCAVCSKIPPSPISFHSAGQIIKPSSPLLCNASSFPHPFLRRRYIQRLSSLFSLSFLERCVCSVYTP